MEEKMDLYIYFGMGVFLLFCMVFAIIRKSFRTKFRFLTVLLSAIAAFVFTLLLKSNLAGLVDGALLPQLDIYYPEVASTLRELMGFSPTLTVLLENTACSMLAPLLFLTFFIVISAVTWVVYFIITLLFSIPLRKRKRKPMVSAIYGLLQGVIILIVWLIPVISYLEMAPVVIDEITDSGVLSAEQSTAIANREEPITATVYQLNDTVVVKYGRAYGGGYLANMLTDI